MVGVVNQGSTKNRPQGPDSTNNQALATQMMAQLQVGPITATCRSTTSLPNPGSLELLEDGRNAYVSNLSSFTG
jgi:hypothetical protein